MPEVAGEDWSDREVEAVLGLYLDLLDADLAGRRVVKAEAYRELVASEVPARSVKAVEYKLQNISAVMLELGLPRVRGLAPARNIQGSLTDAVRSRLLAQESAARLDHLVELAADRTAEYAVSASRDTVVAPPDPDAARPKPLRDVRQFDWDEAERRRLGLLGEHWVLEHERHRLDQLGRADLARDVLHVSVEQGDGAGFDIRSFSDDGTERLVEVKTTASPIGRAFYVSRNELDVSREQETRYWLYRVFDFYERPRMYQLQGSLDARFELRPSTYIARPKGMSASQVT